MAKAPAKKPVTKKATASRPKASTKTVAVPTGRREESMSIRKISNGYIVRESWMEGNGPNAKFQERETFTKVKPSIVLPK
ncbi:hypothetical protein C7441_11034 [Pseudaminobacter salicylatoxidans]|uniref:Uncharacterized protein n=1 Tax=Pseudaminobacter salicylatoxidans TaxID=93369 RepID=A0A316C0I2_PSESE|nr:hypothetical protein [Pseudaminobacter salicylatoxidans]PWJ81502.1 hypothetical protein C7441_11034 [Pseudaminobacter salicylatoxidans]